jgi:hypothetical protein
VYVRLNSVQIAEDVLISMYLRKLPLKILIHIVGKGLNGHQWKNPKKQVSFYTS